MMARVRVCPAGEIPPGGVKAVAADGGEVAVFNVGGAFHAMDNTCPHRGAPLSDGRLEGCVVVCPWHGWQFDVTTGALLMSASSKQKTYKVTKEGDDLYVEI
jgi:nitrite reductase (NADH) small subunit